MHIDLVLFTKTWM